ncbi:hypothetical protein CA603_26510 [Paraburkholderia hospita]|nr:hypothetical protein CA603_26510 [Paraburkholderia hospita]
MCIKTDCFAAHGLDLSGNRSRTWERECLEAKEAGIAYSFRHPARRRPSCLVMGYGMGPGMMRGYGMGSGMGFNAWAGGLDLTDAQRANINRIQDETRKAHWTLMGNMLDREARVRDLYEAPKRDSAEIAKTYKTIDAIRQKMFDSSIDVRKRIEALLMAQQQARPMPTPHDGAAASPAR